VLVVIDSQQEEVKDSKSIRRAGGVIKRQINSTDLFEVNTAFEARLKRIAINTLQKKETKQETEQTLDKVIHDRKFLVDAAIVRTMKARTKLAYNDLVSEVIRLVRFPLDISLMKQRIEDLIDKEYMSRDPKELSVFHYVA
jgi:hypothetical protein